MTENNKPEWFEITDKDEKPELRKVSKSLPVSAVLVAALILGVGAVMGQTQNETPASAVTANAVQATDSQASPASTAVSAVKSAVSNPATAAVVGAAAASNDSRNNYYYYGRHHLSVADAGAPPHNLLNGRGRQADRARWALPVGYRYLRSWLWLWL